MEPVEPSTATRRGTRGAAGKECERGLGLMGEGIVCGERKTPQGGRIECCVTRQEAAPTAEARSRQRFPRRSVPPRVDRVRGASVALAEFVVQARVSFMPVGTQGGRRNTHASRQFGLHIRGSCRADGKGIDDATTIEYDDQDCLNMGTVSFPIPKKGFLHALQTAQGFALGWPNGPYRAEDRVFRPVGSVRSAKPWAVGCRPDHGTKRVVFYSAFLPLFLPSCYFFPA